MLASLLRKSLAPAAIACALLPAASCGRAPDPAAAKPAETRAPIEVRLSRVTAGTLPRVVRANGTLAADDVVTIASEVAGRIVALSRDVGDRVKSGELLARVDDADYVLERDQRRRALSEVLARIGLDALPEGDVDFEHLPSVERARLESDNAKAKLERFRTLHDRTPPLVSDQDFADVQTAFDVAVSGHRLAVLNARADLATARTRRAELDVADKRLRDTNLLAPGAEDPAGGNVYLVAARLAAAGDRVTMGTPLYRLVDADPLRLRVQVPERRMDGVAVGRHATLWIASSKKPVTGLVARIRPEVDTRTRTVDVEISVANPDFAFAAGAFATAEIDVGADAAVPLVPESSVRTFAGVRKVFVVGDGKAAERLVVVGRTSGADLEITSGLKAGDEFVLDPPPELVAGAPVRIAASAPAGAPK